MVLPMLRPFCKSIYRKECNVESSRSLVKTMLEIWLIGYVHDMLVRLCSSKELALGLA